MDPQLKAAIDKGNSAYLQNSNKELAVRRKWVKDNIYKLVEEACTAGHRQLELHMPQCPYIDAMMVTAIKEINGLLASYHKPIDTRDLWNRISVECDLDLREFINVWW